MKVRIKFSKEGAVKFVGHLDTMRYFQKAIRRAKIPVAFSGGYSPHMIMSFAAPLGVGVTSRGEYFDLELREEMPVELIQSKLNEVMAEGFQVLSVIRTAEKKSSNSMAMVAAADYLVSFREGKELAAGWKDKIEEFYAQKEIVVLRKTKRSEKETDIKPWIYQLQVRENQIFLQLSTGSVHNLKPDLVIEAFASYLGEELKPHALQIHKCETYADLGTEEERKLEALDQLGES